MGGGRGAARKSAESVSPTTPKPDVIRSRPVPDKQRCGADVSLGQGANADMRLMRGGTSPKLASTRIVMRYYVASAMASTGSHVLHFCTLPANAHCRWPSDENQKGRSGV